MKKMEKIKFTILGFIISLAFFGLISATISSNDDGEIGRYQVVSSSGDHQSVYALILDTKTGDFIEGEGYDKSFIKKKNINKGNFKELFTEVKSGK